MQVQTIRITSEPSHDNPEGFVIINLVDFDGTKHEPFDDESRAALSGAVKSGEIVPSMAELLAARDALQARADELAAREQALAERERASTAAPDITAMTKDELQATLKAKGIDFPSTANKAELQALLTA